MDKTIEECWIVVSECICDMESLIKCNQNAVTDDVKTCTAKAFRVLNERANSCLQIIQNNMKV
jgi:hypothetical protein